MGVVYANGRYYKGIGIDENRLRNVKQLGPLRYKYSIAISLCTVKGELRVANFLVNSFKRGPLVDTCGCVPLPGCTLKYC
jgi:hypothetical protein